MEQEIHRNSLAERVLKVFQHVNPSAVGIEDPTVWSKFSAKLMRRFVDEYKLPIRLFREATVLDVGCGTGEKSLVFASWGAKVTGVDYNQKALERARSLAAGSRFASRPTFYQSAHPDLPESVCSQEFDICYVDGVVQHVPDPTGALDRIAARVAVGGWLVIRNYQSITSLQRLLKRILVRLGTSGADESIVANTKRLFSEDLRRSVVLGGRTEDQALYDNFVNPLYRPFRHNTIFELCRTWGFQVYALSPGCDAPGLLGPGALTDPAGEANQLSILWWAASLARSMITTEPASSALKRLGTPLEACSKACGEMEASLDDFSDQPTAENWDRVVEGVFWYLSASRGVFKAVYEANEIQFQSFLEELEEIRPIIKNAIERQTSVEKIPQGSVLFRKMSGMAMASWVLWKAEPPRANPFQSNGN